MKDGGHRFGLGKNESAGVVTANHFGGKSSVVKDLPEN